MLAQFSGLHYPQQSVLPCSSQRVRIARPRSSNGSTAVAVQRRSSNVVDYANGLGSLVRSNRINEAVSLLDMWLDEQRRPHGLSTGDLLEALCKEGRHETAWRLIRRLSASKNRLALKVLHRLLKLAGQHGTVDDVLAVYEHQQQLYGFASTGVQTTLIHALLKADSKAKSGNLLAYEAWGRLSSSGRHLDAQALLAGMHACVCVGRLNEAEALLEPLREAAGAVGRPVVSAFNLLMKAHAKAADPDAARKIFATMKARGLTPDAVTYNTLLSSFVAAGEVVRARAVLDKMRREGVRPDVWTYTTLVLGLGRQGHLQEMREALLEMAAAGIQSNSATYAAVIDAYATAGDMEAAHAAMQQLCNQQQQQPRSQHQQVERRRLQQQQQQELEQQWWRTEQAADQQQQLTPLPPQLLLQQQQQLAALATNGGRSDAVAAGLRQVAEPQRQVMLRQMYNTLIRGHLQLAAASRSTPGSSAVSSAASPSSSPASSWDDGVQRMSYGNAAAAAAAGTGRTSSSATALSAMLGLQAAQTVEAAAASSIAAAQRQGSADCGYGPAAAGRVDHGLYDQEAAAAAVPKHPAWNPQAALVATAAATEVDSQAAVADAAAAAAAAGTINPISGYQAALAVLAEMSAAGVPPGVDTYTLLIHHLIKAQDPEGVQLLLQLAAAMALQPDQVMLTSLLKAAGQAGNFDLACEIFDMLILAAMPEESSMNSSSSSSANGEGSQQQQQQLQLELLAEQLSSSSSTTMNNSSSASSSMPNSTVTSSSHIKRQQQQQQRQRSAQQQHQPKFRRGKQQQLLPLTASNGPDAVAWNALAAVSVQTGRLHDAAAAVERAVQAAAAGGQKSPPVEGFAALIRGYRHAGMKNQAVATLRRFLSLGGRPVRVMWNDVITLCLRDNDVKTARQVVRAMELTGCVSDADIANYHAWFERWQVRSEAVAAAAAASAGTWLPSGGSRGSGGSTGTPQADAVERLKWWLGLPNSYYERGSPSNSGDEGRR